MKVGFISETCVTVDFGDVQFYDDVIGIKKYLEKNTFSNLLEMVPTYTSLSIYLLHPHVHALDIIQQSLKDYFSQKEDAEKEPPRLVKIPVCYDEEFGWDMESSAQKLDISTDELISIHSSTIYKVYMLGFVPGFPYMGKVSESIRLPRLSKARKMVSAGSVGIAGHQTGIYPSDISGGWPIIGRTPLRIFDPEAEQPFLLQAGDEVQFYPIAKEEFFCIQSSTK